MESDRDRAQREWADLQQRALTIFQDHQSAAPALPDHRVALQVWQRPSLGSRWSTTALLRPRPWSSKARWTVRSIDWRRDADAWVNDVRERLQHLGETAEPSLDVVDKPVDIADAWRRIDAAAEIPLSVPAVPRGVHVDGVVFGVRVVGQGHD